MSNTLTRAARPLQMDPIAKAVLMALADMAREPDDPDRGGQAWPPMHGKDGAIGLCEWTCLSERSVQRGVRVLLAAGHITRRQLSHGALYTVQLAAEPVSPVTQSPDSQSPDSQSFSPDCQAPKALVSTIPKKASPSKVSARAKPAADDRGSRLSPDWTAPADWIAWAKGERGWTATEAEAEADTFRDYWIGKPGKEGRKSDWPATWRNWVRRSRRQAGGSDRDEGRTVRAMRRVMSRIEAAAQ